MAACGNHLLSSRKNLEQNENLWTLLLKLGQIFDEVAKLGKSTQDTYNRVGWLILQALLKNGVAEGVASDSHDTNNHGHPSL